MKFRGYTGWTDSLPQNPTEKDIQSIAKKMKTYALSSKLLRQGSTMTVYDKKNAQGVKVPVTKVRYMTDMDDTKGIGPEQLKDLMMTAIINKDPQLIRQATKYKFMSGTYGLNAKQQKKKQKQQFQKALQRQRKGRAALGWILGGSGAVAGASLPFLADALQQRPVTVGTALTGLKIGAIGLGSGVAVAAVLNSMKDMKNRQA